MNERRYVDPGLVATSWKMRLGPFESSSTNWLPAPAAGVPALWSWISMPELVVPARAWCDQPGIDAKMLNPPVGTSGVSNDPFTIRFGAAVAVATAPAITATTSPAPIQPRNPCTAPPHVVSWRH